MDAVNNRPGGNAGPNMVEDDISQATTVSVDYSEDLAAGIFTAGKNPDKKLVAQQRSYNGAYTIGSADFYQMAPVGRLNGLSKRKYEQSLYENHEQRQDTNDVLCQDTYVENIVNGANRMLEYLLCEPGLVETQEGEQLSPSLHYLRKYTKTER